jgi:hypothetical protein
VKVVEKTRHMTTEEFYARALLAAMPKGIEFVNQNRSSLRPPEPGQIETQAAHFAHDYAVALTEAFEKNRKIYSQKTAGDQD